MPQSPLRLALIGAGVFVRDAHLPSLLRHPDRFRIAAIYSRTQATAETLGQAIPYPVPRFTDLDALLAQPDVDAVDVVLPIAVMPDVMHRVLAAGKHLISEKPIAPDTTTARRLLADYAHHPQTVWMVGENWRYEAAFLRAAELVADGVIGTPLTCHWAIFSPVTPQSKYYHTLWRRNSSFPGGFLLDGGVHHIATLRLILGEITEVTAAARLVRDDLPPLDTLATTLRFANGCLGTYLASYATAAPWPPHLHIVGSGGSLRVQRREVEVTRDGKTERFECDGFNGVEQELIAFAESVQTGAPHRNTPAAALADLAVMEAILTSAANGNSPTPVMPQ